METHFKVSLSRKPLHVVAQIATLQMNLSPRPASRVLFTLGSVLCLAKFVCFIPRPRDSWQPGQSERLVPRGSQGSLRDSCPVADSYPVAAKAICTVRPSKHAQQSQPGPYLSAVGLGQLYQSKSRSCIRSRSRSCIRRRSCIRVRAKAVSEAGTVSGAGAGPGAMAV